MSTPLITWSCIVGLFAIIMISKICRLVSCRVKGKRNFISLMTEREEFFVPGDPDPRRAGDIDLDEFDYD